MARLEYPAPESLSKSTTDILSLTANINIFKMMGHCETLISPFLALGGTILMATKIDPILRELAIVRAAVHCNSSYEMRQHDAIALEVGVTQEQLDCLHDLSADLTRNFNQQEQTIVLFSDEIIKNVAVSDETFARVKSFLTACEIQELIIAIGYYSMVGRFLETLQVDLETGEDVEVVKISKVRENMTSK